MHLKTLQNSILTLPEEKRSEIEQQLIAADSEETIKKIVKDNFDAEQYSTNLRETFSEMIRAYIETIHATLSEQQIAELENNFK